MNTHCVKNFQIRSFFWSVLSRLRTRKNSAFGYFSHSDIFFKFVQISKAIWQSGQQIYNLATVYSATRHDTFEIVCVVLMKSGKWIIVPRFNPLLFIISVKPKATFWRSSEIMWQIALLQSFYLLSEEFCLYVSFNMLTSENHNKKILWDLSEKFCRFGERLLIF